MIKYRERDTVHPIRWTYAVAAESSPGVGEIGRRRLGLRRPRPPRLGLRRVVRRALEEITHNVLHVPDAML